MSKGKEREIGERRREEEGYIRVWILALCRSVVHVRVALCLRALEGLLYKVPGVYISFGDDIKRRATFPSRYCAS